MMNYNYDKCIIIKQSGLIRNMIHAHALLSYTHYHNHHKFTNDDFVERSNMQVYS